METVKKITLDLYNKNIVSINAKQYDDKTRYVEITTVEDGVIFNIDKTKMSAFLRLKKPDNKGVFNEVEITSEGKMRIELTQQILATPGRAVADIMLFNTIFSSEEKPTNIENINEINAPIISIMNFYINITPTALDHSLIESSNEFNALTNALSKVDYNNKLINENEKIRQANEEIRKSNESIRIDNENTRKQNEINRINEENARIQQESIRKTNEQNRITTENTRVSNENKRESNESTRKSNESQRQTNETNRTSSEDKRISAETDRQFNETTRQDNEDIRKSNENSRISNETTRSNSENERIKNENTRISNETTRQAQENKRQTDSATAITNANNAAKNANDKANDLQNKLDNNYFVLTNELENSVSSTSTTHAPTANAVKTAYDKAVSVENTINSNKNNWNDKYTKNEIDNKFSTLENNIDWKESVNTFADIAKTYPKPEDGWTVNVKDTDYTYRYSGDKWVAISANAIPKATQSVDGLLSKEDKVNYDDANSKKHTHSNKSALDSITSALIATWNKVTDKLDKTGDASNTTNSITIATNRENLTTGEKLSVSLGKIKKWFTDLKNVAFTGSYNDLSDKPTIPAVGNGTITIKQAGTNKGTFTMNQSGNTTIELTDSNTTYSNATTSTAGLMSPDDKTALNNLKTGAVIGVKGNSETTYRTGNVNITPANIGLGNVNNTADANKSVKYAESAGNSTYTNIVNGTYTGKGGSQAPSYISGGNVRFNMMNCFKGLTALPTYADCLLMDTYTGFDVPYVTGLGIIKASGNPRAFIAVGAKGNTTTWASQAELITSANISSQNVSSSDHVYSIDGNKTKRAMTFNWAGKSGQPTWLWGGENGVDMYVYSPVNFNVRSAKYVCDVGDNDNASIIGIGCGRTIEDDDIGHLNGIACYTDSLDDESTTAEIHYTAKDAFKKWLGINPLFTTSNDAANIPGGNLNNVVINSEYGVSFTTSHANSTYTNKTAVSINCREGGVLANYFTSYSNLSGYNANNKFTVSISNSGDTNSAGAIYLANNAGNNTLGLLGNSGDIYCMGYIKCKTFKLSNFYGSEGTCAVNRTPANDVSFAWSPSEKYLRIYIDNTIIATYSWDSSTWI